MARSFLVGIDLNKNQLSNAVIQNLAGAPGSPAEGQIYYDTSTHILYFYNGAGWVNAGGISTGTLSGRPSAASSNSGTFYYATDNYLIYYSNGTTWQQVDNFGSVTSQTSYGASSTSGSSTNFARADHTHGTPALGTSTPANVAGVTGSAGSASVPSKEDHTHALIPTADISWAGYKITNLADPSVSTDAANKNYVDSVAQGLNIHDPVKAATPGSTLAVITGGTVTYNNGTAGVGATLTLSVALNTLDGYTVVSGDRLMIKNEATSANNGVYTINAGKTVLTRAIDSDTPTELNGGDFYFVQNGTVNDNTGWVVIDPITTIGTTPVVFAQFSGAGTYTASNGVVLTGSDFSFAPLTTGGLQTASGGASIKLQTNSGLGTTSNGLAVGAGSGIVVSTGTVAIDTAVVVRKYGADVGDGSSTSITVTHNLGTKDVSVTLFSNASPYAEVMCDVQHTTTNTVTLLFSVAPTSAQYRVAVLG